MSDLFGNHIVGFPTRRLKCDEIFHVNFEILLYNQEVKKMVMKCFVFPY